MPLRLLSYLCLLLIVLCGCEMEDDNFDVPIVEPQEQEPVIVEVGTPFFRLETPNGEVYSSFGYGLSILEENGLIVSSVDIICEEDRFWQYQGDVPELALTINTVVGTSPSGIFTGFATLATTDQEGNPVTGYSRGFEYFDCDETMGTFELIYRSDSTLAGTYEGEIIVLTDTSATAPCNGYTSIGIYKASFFAYLTDCGE